MCVKRLEKGYTFVSENKYNAFYTVHEGPGC